LRPFLLEGPDQFRPGPPPALTSREWAAQYNEVKRIGGISSTVRTAEQTDVARFFTTHSIAQYNTAYAYLVQKHQLDAVDAARLYAMGNLMGTDALIACFDAKYLYLFWRPQYAIPLGDTDGNPSTIADPTWKPLLATPNHPEYIGGHGCYTTAQAETLAAFLGTNRIDLELTSTVPGLLHPTRHYARVNDLVREITDARVWGGIHYRGSAVMGSVLGRKVVRYALARYFLPLRDD
jgi:hypothetical protein